jgi:hypothetical protein
MASRIVNCLFVLSVLFGCSEEKELQNCMSEGPVCSVNDPATELDWLNDKIEEMAKFDLYKYQYVTSATLDGSTVFILLNCCPFCDSFYPVYNCSGEQVGMVGDGKIDVSILDRDKLVWKSENFQCVI